MAISKISSNKLVSDVRVKILLRNSTPITFRHLFSSMIIGYMANNVLPARMGEVVRMYLLERSAGISKSMSAATIVLERIIDALVLLTIVGTLSVFLPSTPLIRRSSLVAGVTLAAVGIALLCMAFKGESAARQTARIVGAMSQKLGYRAQQVVKSFSQGLGVLRSIKQTLLVLLLTLTIWTVDATAVTMVIRSLNLSLPWIAA